MARKPNLHPRDTGGGIPKQELLGDLGFGAVALPDADAILDAAGLSNARKTAISAAKVEAVETALSAFYLRVCNRGDCRAEADGMLAAGDAREIVSADATRCDVCGGSSNARAVDDLVAACREARWRRVCVVGGSPNSQRSLRDLVGDRLELRLVEGDASRTIKRCRDDVAWADIVAIWGSTILDHRVSRLYTGPNVVLTNRRGIRDLCHSLVESVRLRGAAWSISPPR